MTSPQHSLNLVSFNCRGWNLGQLSVKDLLRSHDICFIQEHWLLQDQLGLLNVDSDFLSIGVSGMDSSKLLLGRPYGGCAILYKRSLLPHISKLDSTSKRFSVLPRPFRHSGPLRLPQDKAYRALCLRSRLAVRSTDTPSTATWQCYHACARNKHVLLCAV